MKSKKGAVTFLIADEKLDKLGKKAVAHGVTLNNLLNSIVDVYIENHEGCGICEYGALPEQKSLEATN